MEGKSIVCLFHIIQLTFINCVLEDRKPRLLGIPLNPYDPLVQVANIFWTRVFNGNHKQSRPKPRPTTHRPMPSPIFPTQMEQLVTQNSTIITTNPPLTTSTLSTTVTVPTSKNFNIQISFFHSYS